MESEHLQQAIQNIELQMSQKKYKEAYFTCKNLLEMYPDNKKLQKLKVKIEKRADAENEEMVKNQIPELKKLIKEEKYVEAIKKASELEKISPQIKKIQKLKRKAQEEYRNLIEKDQKNFHKNLKKQLEKTLKENPSQLLDDLTRIESSNRQQDKLIIEIVKDFKDKLIAKKIHDKPELMESGKEGPLANFIDQLKDIDKENPRVKKLQDRLRELLSQQQIESSKDFIYQGIKHLETLMQLKKYSKAIKTAEEILSVDPKNTKVQRILEKATSRNYDQCWDKTLDLIQEDQKKLQQEYSDNKDRFIRI